MTIRYKDVEQNCVRSKEPIYWNSSDYAISHQTAAFKMDQTEIVTNVFFHIMRYIQMQRIIEKQKM